MKINPNQDGKSVDNQESDFEQTLALTGQRLRELRKEKGHTLESLSERTSLSTGLISQLERGVGNPTMAALVKLSHALDTSIAQLLHTPSTGSPVVRADERILLQHTKDFHATDARISLLTQLSSRQLEVVWVEIPVGHSTEQHPDSHPGEEFGLVISGTHEIHVGGDTFILNQGDSITYPSTIPHWFRNPGNEPAQCIWVITPPTW